MAGVSSTSGHEQPDQTSFAHPGATDLVLWQRLVELLPGLVWTTDQRLRFTSSNGAGLSALGLRPGQVIGMALEEYFGRSDPGFPPLAAHRAALQGRSSEFQQIWAGRTFRCFVDPLLGPDGEVRGTTGIALDVTDQKRAERALREREEELTQAQRLEVLGRLAGSIAHDFNNALQSIVGHAHRVATALPDSDTRRADLAQILTAAEKATLLTRQLILWSRPQGGRPELVDLGKIVLGMRPLVERLAGVRFQVDVNASGGACEVTADGAQVEQALAKLVLHATDAVGGRGHLLVETGALAIGEAEGAAIDLASGRYAALVVRARGLTDATEGEGGDLPPAGEAGEESSVRVALAPVFGLVKQSHGQLFVESGPGRVVTMRLYLPAAPRPRAMDLGELGKPKGAGETVLLVDDEPAVRAFVRRTLEDYGYRVLDVGTGDEALSLAQSYPGPIHLLLTDVLLPSLNGPQVAARLAPLRPEMRILYMTGYADTAVVDRGVVAAGQALLVKPFTPLGLAHEVRKVLRV
jgi:two-component system, cell cycle sensor histidine kinase and response regulator CckA